MNKPNIKTFNLVLFFFILIFFVLPPIFSEELFIPAAKPAGFSAFLLQTVNIFFAAMFEELLYRVYLPFCMEYFFKPINNKRFNYLIIEFIPVLLFALAHKYLGLKNVIFAFVSGCLLRFLFVKINKKINIFLSLIIVSLIHGIYNFAVYIIVWFY